MLVYECTRGTILSPLVESSTGDRSPLGHGGLGEHEGSPLLWPDRGHGCRQARRGAGCHRRSAQRRRLWVSGPAHPTALTGSMPEARYAGGCNGGGTLPLPRLCCSTTHILRSSVNMPLSLAFWKDTADSARRSLRTGGVMSDAWCVAPCSRKSRRRQG